MKLVNVLGTYYTLDIVPPNDDAMLKRGDCDAWTDKTSKRIVVAEMDDSDLDKPEVYQKEVIRHEIIHAFLNESGLQEAWEHKPFGHEETTVDWIAKQFPKLYDAFVEADCL